MTVQIIESGVTFGDFAPEDVFEIEKSNAVKKLGDGVSKVEFIVKQHQVSRIVFLEAKSSFPRESDAFFDQVKQKMVHSLIIWFSAVVGRHEAIKAEIGQNLQKILELKKPIQLILVIPNMPDKICFEATEKFRKVMRLDRRLWNIKETDIRVLNLNKVSKLGLVVASCN